MTFSDWLLDYLRGEDVTVYSGGSDGPSFEFLSLKNERGGATGQRSVAPPRPFRAGRKPVATLDLADMRRTVLGNTRLFAPLLMELKA